MKKLFFVFMILAVCACKQTCTLETDFVTNVGQGTAKLLQCANEPAIEASLQSAVTKLVPGFCATPVAGEKTGIAPTVCPFVANLLVSTAVGIVVPSAWGCTATNLESVAIAGITTACTGILPMLNKKP